MSSSRHYSAYKTFYLISHIISGYPNREDEYYNEQEYQYDYDDDKVEYSEENRRDEISFRPQIVSDPVKLDVDNGMTIRLPCLVDKLPGEDNNKSGEIKAQFFYFTLSLCFEV